MEDTLIPVQPVPSAINGSLLIPAAMEGHLDVVKRILSKGVEKERINKAFIAAVDKGQLRMVAYLGLKGADVDIQDGRALMLAAYRGNLPMVMLLVSLGINIHVRRGEAVIHSIAEHRMGVTRYLFSQGIRVSRYSLLLELTTVPCKRKCEAWTLGCELCIHSKQVHHLGDDDLSRMVANYL